MPIKNPDDNRDYQRLWARDLLARETPEEREARLARRRANAAKRRADPKWREKANAYQRDLRFKHRNTIVEAMDIASRVWYLPLKDELIVGMVSDINEDDIAILIGDL